MMHHLDMNSDMVVDCIANLESTFKQFPTALSVTMVMLATEPEMNATQPSSAHFNMMSIVRLGDADVQNSNLRSITWKSF